MPLYDYRCASCSHEYEVREGFDAPPRQTCPKCGGVAKRLLHPPPIVFKGSGFYITDSRKGHQATLSDNGYSSASSDAKDGSDAKPAAATTTSSTSTPDTSAAD